MKNIVSNLAIASILTILGANSARAASRTWVSGVGDDANPGSRTAPCKTFAGAISRTDAFGEINVLDPGGFGTLTITKSITIDGSGGSIAGVQASNTNGIVVSAGSNDIVTLRNLDLCGLESGLAGIKFLSGKELHIENCVIYGFTGVGIDCESTTSGAKVFISNCSIHDCAGGGVLLRPGSGGSTIGTIEKSYTVGNLFGVRVEANAGATVDDTTAAHNAGTGFIATASGELNINHSVSSNNAFGVAATGSGNTGSIVRISDVNVFENSLGLYTTSPGVIASFQNNHITGNGTNGSPNQTLNEQ